VPFLRVSCAYLHTGRASDVWYVRNSTTTQPQEGGSLIKVSSNEEVEAISKQWLSKNPDLDSFLSTWTIFAVVVGAVGVLMMLYSEVNACLLYR
jgi:hypothetical protein